MKNITLISAIDKNYGIGKNGDLLCRLPSDMNNFKFQTHMQFVIMGYNTYKSLNRLTGLSKRLNIIITEKHYDELKPKQTGNLLVFRSPEEVINTFRFVKADFFVIGGETIYKFFFPYANRLMLTEIHYEFDSPDVFFPRFNKSQWTLTDSIEHQEKGYNYNINLYLKNGSF